MHTKDADRMNNIVDPDQTAISGADPGFLDRGFKFAEGVRFDHFAYFFTKFLMKMK